MDKFNEHILLVMRWLQNPGSKNEKELLSDYRVADKVKAEAYRAVRAAADNVTAVRTANPHTITDAYYAAQEDLDIASLVFTVVTNFFDANAAAYHNPTDTEYSVNKTEEYLDEYFKTTNEDRKAYENRARHLNILGAKNG